MSSASAVKTETFKHERLPNASAYIRLLEVVSVDETRDIKVHCKLTTWMKAHMPAYTAISYTWGDPRLLTDILVNGKRMEVRRNCEDVLRQPCREKSGYFFWNKGDYFWIDAICINQTDNEEKSFQVANMGRVFMGASRTLACVGRHENDSEFLFEMLHQHRTFWAHCCATRYDVEKLPGRLLRILRFESTMIRLLSALRLFLKRPYFYRVWIYQELFFGQNIQLWCEDKSVKLLLLRGLYSALHEYLRYIGLEGNMESIKSVGPLLDDGVSTKATGHSLYSLWQMIHAAGQLQCEDVRDRVYGTLSMIDWQGRTPIQPDYSKDAFDLAVELLMRFVYDDFHNNINSVLSNSVTIARLLRLTDRSPSQLNEEIQKRIWARFEAPTRDRVPEDAELILSEFWGKRLYFHDASSSWQIRPPPSRDDFAQSVVNTQRAADNLFDGITVQIWSARGLRDTPNTSILLPPEVQPQDWVLLPYLTENASQTAHLAFIARDVGDRQLRFVGKALAKLRPDRPMMSAWERVGATFEIYLDPKDAIILAYSCNWRNNPQEVWGNEDEPHKGQVDEYFKTSLCGKSTYSYATR